MVVLQITADTVRVLRGQWPNIAACAEKARASQDALMDDIRDVFSRTKVSSGACVLLLSRREAVFKEAGFPSRDPHEISRMIALQVPALVPYEKDQTVYDHHFIRITDTGYSDIVMAVIPEGVIQRYVAAVQAAGLTVSDVYLNSDGVDCLLRTAGPDHWADAPCCAVVCMDAGSSEILFYRQGQWVFSFYLAYGFQEFSRHGQEAVQEIARCADAFMKSHPGAPVEQVWVADVGAQTDALKARLFDVRQWTVESFDFRASLPEAARGSAEVQQMNSCWIPVLGCLVKDVRTRFMNFLPKGVSVSQAQRQERKDWLSFFSAAAAAGIFIFLLCWGILYKEGQRLAVLERQAFALDPLMEKMRSESDFLEAVIRTSDRRYSAVRAVKEIYELIPEDVSVQSLGMRLKGGFELQGTALKDQSVNQLHSALVSSAFFSRVDLQYATRRRRFDTEYTEFKLVFFPGP